MLKFFSEELLGSKKFEFNKIFDTPGTHTGEGALIIPKNGVYEIEAVSGGAGATVYDDGNQHVYSNTGSSGAYYNGKIRMQQGTYTVIIGAGGSTGWQGSSGGGGFTRIGQVNEIFQLNGAGPTGIGSAGSVGYLQYVVNEVERINYSPGNSGGVYVSINVMTNGIHGTVYSPAANYGLGKYGQGGATNCTQTNLARDPGTGGYLRVTYVGR